MIDTESTIFIHDIPWWYIRTYFKGRTPLFRHYQNLFLERFGREFSGHVIELGCEKHYQHRRFFPNVGEYLCTNIAREHDIYLDITNMAGLADQSQDGFICISVLEHVSDFQKALDEINRTLKIGGRLILTVPFLYWRHDDIDYWRFSENFYTDYFPNYEIKAFVHMGGRLSVLTDMLQKPYALIGKRLFVYKILGLLFALLGKYFDIIDEFPLGYGIYAIKRD